jgi:hypothetical protein
MILQLHKKETKANSTVNRATKAVKIRARNLKKTATSAKGAFRAAPTDMSSKEEGE